MNPDLIAMSLWLFRWCSGKQRVLLALFAICATGQPAGQSLPKHFQPPHWDLKAWCKLACDLRITVLLPQPSASTCQLHRYLYELACHSLPLKNLNTVLVNKTGHINWLISRTPPVTNHRSRSAVDPGCNTSYRLQHPASYEPLSVGVP